MATPPFDHVLVPYDGSAASSVALEFGLGFARRGARLTVAYVVDGSPALEYSSSLPVAWDPPVSLARIEGEAAAILETALERCRHEGLELNAEVLRATPATGITSAAERLGCDLIVMGTHGRDGLSRAVLGSTTEAVLRACCVPMLAVRADTRVPDDSAFFRSLLLAIDDSEPSDAAAAVAARIARGCGSRTEVVTSIEATVAVRRGLSPFAQSFALTELRDEAGELLDRALARSGLAAQGASTAVLDGEPATAILNAARDAGAAAIVVGSHGRRGLRRFLLGSVAERIVRTSNVPVFVVRAMRVNATEAAPAAVRDTLGLAGAS